MISKLKLEKNGFLVEVKKGVAYPLLNSVESHHVFVNGIHEASYQDQQLAFAHAEHSYLHGLEAQGKA